MLYPTPVTIHEGTAEEHGLWGRSSGQQQQYQQQYNQQPDPEMIGGGLGPEPSMADVVEAAEQVLREGASLSQLVSQQCWCNSCHRVCILNFVCGPLLLCTVTAEPVLPLF